MRTAIFIGLALATLGAWMLLRARSLSPGAGGAETTSKKSSSGAGRALRMRMLTTPPEEAGEKPSLEFPRIYGILMDWPIDDEVATVFSASPGAASLYTTSTFGIIGGEGHASVRDAAKAFVRAADRFYAESVRTSEYPYPGAGRVRFYFLTYEGVRVSEADLASIENRTSVYSELFELGQAVLTQLRIVTEKHP